MQATGFFFPCHILLSVLLATRVAAFAESPAGDAKQLTASAQTRVDFVRDVQPILEAHCHACHGSQVQMGGLRLDNRSSLLKGGKSGAAAIVPGKSSESLVIRYVSGLDPKVIMPPAGERLRSNEIAGPSQTTCSDRVAKEIRRSPTPTH